MSDRFLVVVLTLLVSASVACRGSKKQDPGKEVATEVDAGATLAAPAVPVDSASTASAVVALSGESVADGVGDAGPDAGKRRLRRLAAGSDAGPLEMQGAAVVEPSPAAAPSAAPGGKHPAPMSNEAPYGGTAAGPAAPVLQKRPLQGDDPWK